MTLRLIAAGILAVLSLAVGTLGSVLCYGTYYYFYAVGGLGLGPVLAIHFFALGLAALLLSALAGWLSYFLIRRPA